MGKPLSRGLRLDWLPRSREACPVVARQSSSVFRAGAVRWMQAVTTAGTLEAKPQGGDTLSHRIEAFQQRHPGRRGAQKDIGLVELADLLRTEHGASFGASTVWRCLDRHGMTFKNGARRRVGAARRRSPAPGLVRRPA